MPRVLVKAFRENNALNVGRQPTTTAVSTSRYQHRFAQSKEVRGRVIAIRTNSRFNEGPDCQEHRVGAEFASNLRSSGDGDDDDDDRK